MRKLVSSSKRTILAAAILPAFMMGHAARAQDATTAEPTPAVEANAPAAESNDTDILSADTLTLILDGRIVLADGNRRFSDGGFGKTRFDGTSSGKMELQALPIEGSLIWQPRFTKSLSANVSAAWQRDQENAVDLLEAYLTFIPSRSGKINFSAKAGLYWPEISLEHASGGAWSTVYTITPSAINSWVGEEVKVVGAEATLHASLGSQDISLSGAAFGFNDTSGTLLAFRGWALHDLKATAFGHFDLPPLNAFMSIVQEHRTRSLYEIDGKVGFYGRAEWRPSNGLVINAFYYDNRGDPQAVKPSLQWGWRTRFWNFGLVGDLGPRTRLIAQAMTGTTLMGFVPPAATERWVNTRFRSAFALLSQQVGPGALSGRAELFDTKERGSTMATADESEDGWALTAALRMPVAKLFTGFLEVLHVESKRGARIRSGLPAKENQTILQAALRLRW